MNSGNILVAGTTAPILYHGSKNGINGDIKPISRSLCDFGQGFYMGTEKIQPLTLICNFPNARLYTLKMDMSGLRVLDIEVGMDWALLIAYQRGKMEHIKKSVIWHKYAAFLSEYDMVIGDIANDRLFVVLDRFFSGEITDAALIACLSALKLGKQYVALSERACGQIVIVEEQGISESERHALRVENAAHRQEGIRRAEEICKKHRRDGRFFDEILESGV